MEYLVRELRVGDLDEAGKLAAMWNASDDAWPGGWTHGVPETAERKLDRTSKLDRMAIFVVEMGGEIVGYCDVRQERGRDDMAYVPLLNVRPDCHGKGLGKALLLKVLERVVERGFRLLTLGTWAGNLKAVPLYKKVGFFWVPETTVWMMNYIPTALSMPAGRAFFARHDWYRSFQRELQVAPDEIEWNGIKVFPYRFESEGDLFAFRIDRQAEAPTSVETNDFLVECIVGAEEVVCGLEHPIRWQVTNKRGRAGAPLQVTLLAEGEEGIGLNVVESLTVADQAVVERPLVIAPDVKRKEPGLPAHQVRSTLLIDGVPVRLGSAVKPVQPVEIQYGGETLVPGKPEQKIVVRLKSNLGFPVQGELLVDPHPGLRFDAPKAAFALAPKSWTSCTFHVVVQGTGALPTRMRAVCSPAGDAPAAAAGVLATKPKSVTFRTPALDAVTWWQDEESEQLTVATPCHSAYIRLRGGDVSVCDAETGRHLLQLPAPELGPPFAGGRRVPPLYVPRVETEGGKVAVTLSFPYERAPGVSLERTLTFGGGDILRVDYRIVNGSDAPQRLKLRSQVWSGLRGRLTAPLVVGLVHEPVSGWGEYPLGGGDLPKEPDRYAETWSAYEERGWVAGMVFGECEEREQMMLQLALPEVAAGAHHALEPIYLVAGRGNWERVRRLWRSLKQPGGITEERGPVASPVLTAALEPSPLLVTGPRMEATLTVRSRRGKGLTAGLAIAAEGVCVTPAEAKLAGVNAESPFSAPVVVEAGSSVPRVEKVQLRLTDETTTREFPSPVVILGDASRPVAVTPRDAGVLGVDNGCLAFDVAPGFLGSITSLARGGAQLVQSAYPEARAFSFMNPWFGGIHPLLNWMGEQRFVRQQFAGSPVQRPGARGIPWRGVGVAADLSHKHFCWLRMEMEYLTTGGSNVVAIVQRLVNTTDAPQGVSTGVCVWAGIGGGAAGNVLHYRQDRPRYEQAGSTDETQSIARHHRRGQYSMDLSCGRWAAVAHEETGMALALAASHPDVSVGASDQGRDGVMLSANVWASLEPNQTREFVHWLAVAPSVEAAEAYSVLGEVSTLP